MKFSCDECSAQYMIADEKVGDRGVKVKCKKCEHVIVVKPQAAEAAPPEEERRDTNADGGAFNAMFGEGSFNEPTQAMSSSQLDELKARAASSSSEPAPAGADPFGAPAENSDPFGAPAENPDPFGAPAENTDPFGAPAADAGATDSAFGGPTDPGFQDPAGSAFPGAAGAGFDAPTAADASAPVSFDGSSGAGFDASAPVGFDGSSGADYDASAPGGSEGSPGAGFDAPAGDGGADLTDLAGVAGTTPTESDTSGESNLDAAFGNGDAASAAAPAPAPSTTEAGEKEWYVAIDDSQVGPVDVLEIEQRWDSMELDEDTLAWKAGMADWSPVAEIPELAYLVTERPQQHPEVAASAFGASAGAGGTVVPGVAAAAAGGGSLGPVAFGGDSGAEVSDVSWTPSAASALSSLVQDELTAPEPTADPGPAGPSASDMGMPSFGGAADIFGGGGGGGNGGTAPTAPAPIPAMGPAPASDPFSGGSPAWSVPKSESKGNKGLIIGISVAAAAVVIACIVVVVVVVMPKQQQPVQPPIAAVQPPAVVPPQPTPTTQPAVDPTAAQAEDATLKAAGGKAGGGKAGGGKAGGGKGGGGKAGGGKAGGGKAGGGKGGGGKGGGKGIDDIFDKPTGAGSTRVLGKTDIVNGFKKNAGGLKPCIASAAKSGQLARGSHKLVLAWVIQPNGSVSNGRLTGPANVMGTSMPSCFRGKMRTWKFPPSKQPTPVTGYPLPFNL